MISGLRWIEWFKEESKEKKNSSQMFYFEKIEVEETNLFLISVYFWIINDIII